MNADQTAVNWVFASLIAAHFVSFGVGRLAFQLWTDGTWPGEMAMEILACLVGMGLLILSRARIEDLTGQERSLSRHFGVAFAIAIPITATWFLVKAFQPEFG